MSQYREIAQQLVETVRQSLSMQVPQGEGMVLYLPQGISFGCVQRPYLDYDPEMIFLSKTTKALEREIGDVILEIAPEFHRLTIAPPLSLEGRLHICRLVATVVDYMTPDQTAYALVHPLAIFEHASVVFH
ncbi:MAG: hypothetical protein AABX82_08210 [Nanoarchaeota archaeon]